MLCSSKRCLAPFAQRKTLWHDGPMNSFDPSTVKKIGVFTSGGDAPGMNASVRSVVRTAIHKDLEVVGIYQGYRGFLEGNFQNLSARSVANIIQRGGTILKTDRCPEFHKPEVRAKSAQLLKQEGIDAIVCIGGDGSFTGAHLLNNEQGIPMVGIPGTIDNDIAGSEYTIGFDTAINTAVEAVDRIRDTAHSHDRLFIVEVMGRNSGFLAAEVGVAVGAEVVFTPEFPMTVDQAVQHFQNSVARGKRSSIFVSAEGQKAGRSYDLAENIRKKCGAEARVCILGHIQRGGSPSATDRVMASRMGNVAVETLLQGQCNHFIAVENNKLVTQPLEYPANNKKTFDPRLIELATTLAT